MTTRTAMTLTLSALMLGGTMVGCTAQQGGLASMTEAAQDRAVALASESAGRARDALGRHKYPAAVDAAEAAVRWQPREASYRALLGQAYLSAGRFASARDAYLDALTLSPQDGRIALNLALAQIGAGDWNGARQTLDTHVEQIPASDRGLAIALTGDPNAAIAVLTEAARTPGADAKTRQNLALSLALAGRWTESRIIASMDLGADQVDGRMQQWATFAFPHAASDQVASLLGVTPVADKGQPVALALNETAPTAVAAVAPADLPVAAPVARAEEAAPEVAAAEPASIPPTPAPVDAAPAPAAAVAVVPAAASSMTTAEPRPAFVEAAAQPSRPLARKIAVARFVAPKPVALKPAADFAKGTFFVQIGAYENAAVAHDGWTRATRRFTRFAGMTPQGMPVTTNGANFYRVSVGGFTRNDAVALCRQYRRTGGICFVRANMGEQVAQWVQPGKPRQLAMR